MARPITSYTLQRSLEGQVAMPARPSAMHKTRPTHAPNDLGRHCAGDGSALGLDATLPARERVKMKEPIVLLQGPAATANDCE